MPDKTTPSPLMDGLRFMLSGLPCPVTVEVDPTPLPGAYDSAIVEVSGLRFRVTQIQFSASPLVTPIEVRWMPTSTLPEGFWGWSSVRRLLDVRPDLLMTPLRLARVTVKTGIHEVADTIKNLVPVALYLSLLAARA